MSKEYVAAVTSFKVSEQFKTASDPATLMAPGPMRQYLENRLLRAYEAGWRACGAAVNEELKSHT